MSKSAFGLQADDYRPAREPVTFRVTVPRWDDTGTRKDVCFVEPGGTMTKALTDAEMRELAATLLTHLGESFVFPNTLEAEVIRAAGAWVDAMEKPGAGYGETRDRSMDIRDAVKDYRAGVSTK